MTRQLPLTRGALASLAALVVVGAVGSLGLVAPMAREASRLRSELEALEARAAQPPPVVTPLSDAEQAAWARVRAQVRERFVEPDSQYELLVEVAGLARDAGMSVLDVQLEGVGASEGMGAVVTSMALPPNLVVNPGAIRLEVLHGYQALVDVLERLGAGEHYVALEALETRRVEDGILSEIRVVSLRWVETS